MKSLLQKKILLAITGGIAAYKSAELIRLLRGQGAEVRVVMTEHAQQFISPLTLQALSGHLVADNLFDPAAEAAMGHIELARWPDLIVIAPASANCIARLTYGHANDLLTTLCLASQAPIFIAPAMNQIMWQQAITQENIQRLRQRGITIMGPGIGEQACGEVGPGRMLLPTEILNIICQQFTQDNIILKNKKILITAGPTQEALDPIRFLTNHSSGKMGYALANAAFAAGASVTLISGPTVLAKPANINCIDVVTALQMYTEVMERVAQFDIFISAAAVADYRVAEVSTQKLKKSDDNLTLKMIRNPDILQAVANLKQKPFLVGFAAETENLIDNANKKMRQKKLDMIVANKVGPDSGFQQDQNSVIILTQAGQRVDLPLASKQDIAKNSIGLIAKFVVKKNIKI